MEIVMKSVNSTKAEERINSNYNRYNDDEQYLKNIKLDVSNFDDCLDPQYYLDWAMSLDCYFKWYECPKSGEFVLLQ